MLKKVADFLVISQSIDSHSHYIKYCEKLPFEGVALNLKGFDLHSVNLGKLKTQINIVLPLHSAVEISCDKLRFR